MEYELKKEGKFEYLEEGEGPVIVILHGLFGAMSNFQDVVPHFSKKYKVVIPLLPIYTLPVINTHVKALGKFLREFIEFKGYEEVNLLGNSLGGHVGLIYTSRYPEGVRTLTLTGSSGLYENAFGGSFPKRGNYEFIRKKVEYTFFDPKNATEPMVNECFEIVNDKSRALRVIALAKSAIRHNMAKELPTMETPTCLIWGKNDLITPPEVAEEFKELMPKADLFWIDKCGHAPMMEHPEEFNKILTDWYDRELAS
ncbi:alpha/beta hydrolase [bacterium SCSIO 12741]|nr:alpha/beta hydrolase [bacterium SCSIO 12741]